MKSERLGREEGGTKKKGRVKEEGREGERKGGKEGRKKGGREGEKERGRKGRKKGGMKRGGEGEREERRKRGLKILGVTVLEVCSKTSGKQYTPNNFFLKRKLKETKSTT